MYSANCNDSVSETTRAWAEIDLGALKHNFEYAKKRSDRRVICVLKADAYGHGAVKCGQFLQRNDPGGLSGAQPGRGPGSLSDPRSGHCPAGPGRGRDHSGV